MASLAPVSSTSTPSTNSPVASLRPITDEEIPSAIRALADIVPPSGSANPLKWQMQKLSSDYQLKGIDLPWERLDYEYGKMIEEMSDGEIINFAPKPKSDEKQAIGQLPI